MIATTTHHTAPSWAVAEAINAAAAAGHYVRVNGREVFTRWTAPATCWGTGSMSVNVKARGRSRTGMTQLWCKPEERVMVTVTPKDEL